MESCVCGGRQSHARLAHFSLQDSAESKKPLTLVFFLGGVTFAEISALRWLGMTQNDQPWFLCSSFLVCLIMFSFRAAQQDSHPRDYIIATTKLINGDTLLETMLEDVENNLRRETIKAAS